MFQTLPTELPLRFMCDGGLLRWADEDDECRFPSRIHNKLSPNL